MQVMVVVGREIGRKIVHFGGEFEQLVGEFSSLPPGQFRRGLGSGNPAVKPRLLFVAAVQVVIVVDGKVIREITRRRKGQRRFAQNERFFR